MSFIDRIKKSTVANIVAAILVLGGLGYAIYTGNKDMVVWLAGAGLGWLLKEVKN